MNRRCLVVGCGSHSHSVISIVESTQQYVIEGLIDTQADFDNTEEKSGYRVISSLEKVLANSESYSEYYFALAIGDLHERTRIFFALFNKGFKLPNFISTHAIVDRTVEMGQANIIGHNALINSNSVLGNNNLINTAAIVEHDVSIGDHNHMSPKSLVCGNSVVKDYCFIGAGSIILPNKALENRTTIGAGGVLICNVNEENKKLVGLPAKER